jgi:hypothetical protein
VTNIPKTIIRPREGLRVRKPNGQQLQVSGEPVVWNSYWQRRLQDGDIEAVGDDQAVPEPDAEQVPGEEPAPQPEPVEAQPPTQKPRRQAAKE